MFGIFPAPILDGLHYSVSTLIYASEVPQITLAFIPFAFLTKRLPGPEGPRSISTQNKPLSNNDMDPNFITGFSDGEGCFSLTFIKSNLISANDRKGYKLKFNFSIGLHKKDSALLEMIIAYFGVGKIYKDRKDYIRYQVGSLEDLSVIINNFDSYPLITKKFAPPRGEGASPPPGGGRGLYSI